MSSPWYWYAANENEIFLDLDSRRALNRALSVLRRAMSKRFTRNYQNVLRVRSLWLYPTMTAEHTHLIVVLKKPLPVMVRVAWSLWMGGDQIRAAYVMERARRTNGWSELIATRKPYGFRAHDFECECRGKHKRKSVTDNCPALGWMLGEHRSADYFPRNLDRKKRAPLVLPWGQISKRSLLQWQTKTKLTTT